MARRCSLIFQLQRGTLMIGIKIITKVNEELDKNNNLMNCLIAGICPLCGNPLTKQTFEKDDIRYNCFTCVFIYVIKPTS
jgi:hypothetical protein